MSAEDLAAAVRAVPDADNPAEYLKSAEQAVHPKVESPAQSNHEFPQYPPYPAKWHELADRAVATNGKAMALARQARQFPVADWKINLTSPLIRRLPRLGNARNLANLLGDAALREHLRGNDHEALELIADIRHQAAMIDQQPFLVSHLVAVGIDALAIHRLEIIGPGLRIRTDAVPSTAPADPSPATAQQVRKMIQQLLDASQDAGTVRALVHERVAQIDSTSMFADSVLLIRPMFQLDLARCLAREQTIIRAARLDTWPAAKSVLDTLPSVPLNSRVTFSFGSQNTDPSAPRYARMLSSLYVPALERFVFSGYRIQAERRLAATSLAIQLFRADHDGRFPDSLERLVPGYLPEIPRDPCAADAPLRHLALPGALPDGSPRPLVYSVGEDGDDDTASGSRPPAKPQFGWQALRKSERIDEWRDLARWSPPSEQSSQRPEIDSDQAVDDDP